VASFSEESQPEPAVSPPDVEATGAAASARERSDSLVTRRRLVLTSLASLGVGAVAGISGMDIWRRLFGSPFKRFWDVLDQVTPPGGVETTLSFGDSIQKLIAAGALDPAKLRAHYAKDGVPAWLEKLIAAPSAEPIRIGLDTAPNLINLFWPLGLSTRARLNDKSPIDGTRLATFASTSGWTLGRADNGAAYFNKIDSLRLTGEQEERVLQVATTTFRPCCDNPTFFQDCNHGSALLGLIELGASQGKTTDELYRLALAANAHWFPVQYAKTALYFALFEAKE